MSVPTSASRRTADWLAAAACAAKTVDANLFHAGERDPEATAKARAVCNRCPSRTPCLLAAYAEGDEWSVRAGLTPRQRAAVLRKADGNVARAVTDALENTLFLLQQIYRRHAKPAGGGHMVWSDTRNWISVRQQPYTVHQLAWEALHGTKPFGHVQRSCDVEGCVAKACLTDRWMRDRAAAARKQAAG